MKLVQSSICIAALFICIELVTTNDELQGPVIVKILKTNDEEKGESSGKSEEKMQQETSPGETSSETVTNNDRKSSKYVNEKKEIELRVDLTAHAKMIQQALFERLWAEKILKQKLVEQIETIEAKREKLKENEPSAEELEAQKLYEAAMEMFGKPHTNKLEALDLLKHAAAAGHLKARAELAWAYLLGHHYELNFEYAAAEFDELAKEGVPEAHMGLALLYAVGVGGKNVSQPMALMHMQMAALGDDTFAQMALGYRYSFGINVPISCEKSLTYYKRVAKKVASRITFSSGIAVHRTRLMDEQENPGSHETELVDYYQLLADKGDVQSQVGLGQLYYQGGKAIAQNHQKALEYFTQAAAAGNAVGYAFLGKLYLEGSDFIKADNETAFKYFKKAAEMGDPVGQSGLGVIYLNGLGVPKDALKALNYFTQAADQGWVDGQLQLGNMYFTGNGVKIDYKLALKYFNLASQNGHVLAYYNLGIMHAYGMGMLRSCPGAVEFFKNVAERGRWGQKLMQAYSDIKAYRYDESFMQYALLAEVGYEVAQTNAAYLLDRSHVSIFNDRHEDLIRAFYYWKRAAAQGYSPAQVKLGDYHYYGWGTNIDFETAAALYRKASEQQYNAQAMFNLGYMHEQGLGMERDWHLAKRLYDLAAETSTDARVPVALALLKLQILTKLEAIKESPYKVMFFLDESIAANWDLYIITLLTLIVGFIMYNRRPLQTPMAQNQRPNEPNDENGTAREVGTAQNAGGEATDTNGSSTAVNGNSEAAGSDARQPSSSGASAARSTEPQGSGVENVG